MAEELPRAEVAGELDDSRMPFLAHLRELRDRLRNAVIALIVGFVIAYFFKEELFVFLARPFIEAWHRQPAEIVGQVQMYFGSPIDPFWAYLSIALYAGIFVAAPFIFYQLWQFVAPGLYTQERRYGVAFAAASALFFLGGAAFCYFLVMPEVFDFLLGYANANVGELDKLGQSYELGTPLALKPHIFMKDYIALTRKLMLGFGLVFELPLAIFFLSAIGMVTPRGLWRFNRWWIVISFIIGAILTPPDVVSQVFMAVPLIVLYNLSILVAWLMARRREKRDRELGID